MLLKINNNYRNNANLSSSITVIVVKPEVGRIERTMSFFTIQNLRPEKFKQKNPPDIEAYFWYQLLL